MKKGENVENLNPQAVGMDSGVKFRSLALIFNSKFGHNLYSFLKIT